MSRSAKKHDLGNMRESIGADRLTGVMKPVGASSPATIPIPPDEFRVEWSDWTTKKIPLGQILPDPTQPRKTFPAEELEGLARTIKRWGLLQAAAVWHDAAAGGYVLIWGERRWRASKIAGLKKLTCRVYAARPPDGELRILRMVENMDRQDVAPLETAAALRDLVDLDGLSQREIEEALGISQATISRHLALLALPETVKALVAAEKLAPSVAYELKALPAERASAIAEVVVADGLSRDQVRDLASEARYLVSAEIDLVDTFGDDWVRGLADAIADDVPRLIHRESLSPPVAAPDPPPEVIHGESLLPASEAPPSEPEVVPAPPNVAREPASESPPDPGRGVPFCEQPPVETEAVAPPPRAWEPPKPPAPKPAGPPMCRTIEVDLDGDDSFVVILGGKSGRTALDVWREAGPRLYALEADRLEALYPAGLEVRIAAHSRREPGAHGRVVGVDRKSPSQPTIAVDVRAKGGTYRWFYPPTDLVRTGR